MPVAQMRKITVTQGPILPVVQGAYNACSSDVFNNHNSGPIIKVSHEGYNTPSLGAYNTRSLKAYNTRSLKA